MRYGGKLGNNLFGRGFVKYFDRDRINIISTSADANDSWDAIRGCFKINWEANERNAFTLQEGMSPENQAFFRSLMDLSVDMELDTAVRYVNHIR